MYGALYKDAPTDAETRIKWLRLQGDDRYRPQPFEQLATVFERSGDDSQARTIRIEKAKSRARLSKMRWYERTWHRILGLTIGYGYRPVQALWFVAAIVLLGIAVFGIGHERALILPTSKDAYIETEEGERELTPNYQRFNMLVYSIDAFVPLINLRQADAWLPVQGIVRYYLWFHIASGWILSTLLAVGLSGLVQR